MADQCVDHVLYFMILNVRVRMGAKQCPWSRLEEHQRQVSQHSVVKMPLSNTAGNIQRSPTPNELTRREIKQGKPCILNKEITNKFYNPYSQPQVHSLCRKSYTPCRLHPIRDIKSKSQVHTRMQEDADILLWIETQISYRVSRQTSSYTQIHNPGDIGEA